LLSLLFPLSTGVVASLLSVLCQLTAFESLAGGVEALLSGVVILVILLVVWVLPHRFWFTRAMNLSDPRPALGGLMVVEFAAALMVMFTV
jgi:hypothetical protein